MANWCSTDFVIESENKELLQTICNAINDCASMDEPIIPKSSPNWVGNIFDVLGIDPKKADRAFWSSAEIKDGNLHFHEEGAWDRAEAIQVLDQHYTDDDGDSELGIYFISQEFGSDIFETNDEDGLYFKDRYIFDTEDDTEYFSDFEKLNRAVKEFLNTESDFGSIEEMNDALDENSEENDEQDGHVREIEYANLYN